MIMYGEEGMYVARCSVRDEDRRTTYTPVDSLLGRSSDATKALSAVN